MINKDSLTVGVTILTMVAVLVAFTLIGNLLSSRTVYQQMHVPYAIAATSSAVTITASIDATVSCSSNATSSSFGTLTDASVFTAATDASTTISCGNVSSGCTLSVNDIGDGSFPGLYNASSSALIESPDAGFSTSATLAAGTEGYGVQATGTAAGSGGDLNIRSIYVQTGDTVAALTTTTATLASSTSAITGREVVVTHKAAIASATPAGNYTDTITYSCLAN